MEPIQYLRALRRRWVVVVAALVIAVSAAWFTSQVQGPITHGASTYTATTVIWDQSAAIGIPGSPLGLSTLPAIVKLPNVAALAAEDLGGQIDPSELIDLVSAQVNADSGFLEITAVAVDPDQAERVASAFSRAAIRYIKLLKNDQLVEKEKALRLELAELEGRNATDIEKQPVLAALTQIRLDQSESTGFVTIQQPVAREIVSQDSQPLESRLSRILLAALLGLFGGIALALILERFDTKIRTRQRAEEFFGMPVLAEIPVIGRRERESVSVTDHPTGRAADAFRLLGVSIAGAWGATHPTRNGNGNGGGHGRAAMPTTILVTSAGPGDGKTLVSANLAAVYGELGRRVTVVSCDLRRPRLHRLFKLPVEPGLSDLLVSPPGTRPEPHGTTATNVRLVPSGAYYRGPGELLGSDRMQQVLHDLQGTCDVVVLDCSPVLVASDVAPLLPQVDAVLVVARAGRTRVELAQRTADVLARLGSPVVGLALNGAREITMPSASRRYYRPDKGKSVVIPDVAAAAATRGQGERDG